MNTDPYLATKDIEERKRLVTKYMRANLTTQDLGYIQCRKKHPKWFARAQQTFGNWTLARQYIFTEKELKTWGNYKTKESKIWQAKAAATRTKYTNDILIELFKDEYIRLKSIPNFGRFSFCKYRKYKNNNSPGHNTFVRNFGTYKKFYTEVTKKYSNIYFDPIPPYSNEDCKYSLTKAYKDYGFISYDILDYNKGYIDANTYAKKYGSLENACKKFNIPYEDKIRCSKLFLMVKKEIEKLLPLEIIEEKKWPWLIYINPLSVDMFLPFLNLAIEVDGGQHEKEVPMWDKNKESLKKRQIRDKIKDIELPKHNITLIRIKYNEVNKIPIILKPYVKLLKTIQEYCAY